MRGNLRFWFVFFLLCVAQVIVNNCFNFSQLVMVSILPVMVMCIPIRYDTIPTLIVSFVAGLLIDFFSSGVIGLTSSALLLTAAIRELVLRFVFGDEIFSRKEDISMARQGILKMTMAILISAGSYLLVYIWLDSAGTRSFLFMLGKFAFSLFASYLCSLLVLPSLSPEKASKWN